MLIGGYDTGEKNTYLAMIDFYGNRIDNVPFVFRGYGGAAERA